MAKAKRGFTFDYIESRKPNFSKFNLTHDHVTALGSGYLVPLWWTNCVPGDRFNVNLNSFIRLLALSSPMMQREDITIRAFKVPWRILADRKDLDIAYAGDKSGNHIDFPMCYGEYDFMSVGSLADYMQLPLPYEFVEATQSWSKISQAEVEVYPEFSIFPFLAYHRIHHDHFRNEETEDSYLDLFEQHYDTLDGSTLSTELSSFDEDAPSGVHIGDIRKVCWERDYFTSALASSQRGTQVNIPLVGSANVVPTGDGQPIFELGDNRTFEEDQPFTPVQAAHSFNNAYLGGVNEDDGVLPMKWKASALKVDGSSFTGIGAIALRMAMNLQAFMERNNVSGYRMIGNILAHFGVRSSNKQFDEAEYLGGLKAPITISAVNQTSASEAGSTPQGTQTGVGVAQFSGHLFSTFCEEPCIIMVVGYITARSSYSQGLARKWSIKNYLDLYWPEFQTIGEQEIKCKELFFEFTNTPETSNNDNTWAYQSRYAEYKYEPDHISGDLRTSLSYWHQSRLFKGCPNFNNDFVTSNPSDRVFALDSTTYPRPYIGEFYFDVQSVRPMDKYAISRLW